MSRQEAIHAWFQLFPELNLSVPSFASLKDGVAVSSVYSYLSGQELASEPGSSPSAPWFLGFKRIRLVFGKLTEFHNGTPFALTCDASAIARREDAAEIEKLVTMLIAYALKSPKADDVKARMQSLTPENSAQIEALVTSPGDSAKPNISTSRSEPLPASSAPSPLPRMRSDGALTVALKTLEAEIGTLKKSNDALKAEIAEISTQKDDPVTDQQLAEANASIFPLEIGNQTKLSKLQQLSDIAAHLETLRREREELLSKMAQLEDSTSVGRGPDYSILVERLQELKVDPATQDVERLCAEKKDFKRRVRKLKLQIQTLQAKVSGHQDLAVLTERRDFLANLVEVGRLRRARAQINLRILQKKMRQETFRLEMRSLL